MTIQKLLCALLIAAISSSRLQAAALSTQPTLPANIKKTLDAHAAELRTFLAICNEKQDAGIRFPKICVPEWLPDYYIKYGIERVSNAQKVKDTIATHKLHLLSVPEKYIYPLPGTTGKLSDENCLVIAKAVKRTDNEDQQLTLEHVKQLCTLALQAHHYDLHSLNYILKSDGTLCIIDTDKGAMPSAEEVARLKQDWLKHGTRIQDGNGVRMDPDIINHPLTKLELHLYSKHCQYDQQACEYLMNEVQKQEQLRLGLKPTILKRALQIGAALAAAYGIYQAVSALLNIRWVKA